jgi:hypothetical protein
MKRKLNSKRKEPFSPHNSIVADNKHVKLVTLWRRMDGL